MPVRCEEWIVSVDVVKRVRFGVVSVESGVIEI